MVRTSRCFNGISFQLGGPHTLRGVERFRSGSSFADFLLASFQLNSAVKFFEPCFHLKGASKFVSEPHDQKGEGAAQLAAS
jgi:hypothetical protein